MAIISVLLDTAKTHGQIRRDSELAARIGVTKAAISRWRRGIAVPEDRYVPALSLLTEMSAESVLAHLQVARHELRTVARAERLRSWAKMASTSALPMMRQFEHHDPKLVEQALDAVAHCLGDIARQISSTRRGQRAAILDLWTHGYTWGALEAAIRGCGVSQAAAVAALVQIALEKLLGTKEQAANALKKMQTHQSRVDFMDGRDRGRMDWTDFASSREIPISLRSYLVQVQSSEGGP